jgi:hypothetical protein
MLVGIDLSALYFAIRDLNITINYDRLINWLKGEAFKHLCSAEAMATEVIDIHAFTIADSKNQSQSKFLERLTSLGVSLHVYSFNTKPNFSVELGVLTALSEHEKVILLTNDEALMRSFSILEESGKDISLCFFSEKLHGAWTPKVLSGEIKFLDLSNPKTKAAISS